MPESHRHPLDQVDARNYSKMRSSTARRYAAVTTPRGSPLCARRSADIAITVAGRQLDPTEGVGVGVSVDEGVREGRLGVLPLGGDRQREQRRDDRGDPVPKRTDTDVEVRTERLEDMVRKR
jgi:hypothetical protein